MTCLLWGLRLTSADLCTSGVLWQPVGLEVADPRRDSTMTRPTLLDFSIVAPHWRDEAGSDALPEVEVTCASNRTVLFGRNAAGKSSLLEGIAWARTYAGAESRNDAAGQPFKLSLQAASGLHRVDYTLTGPYEFCKDQVGGGWTKEGSAVAFTDGSRIAVPSDTGVLATDIELPPTIAWLRAFLRGMRLLPAGVPRHAARQPILLTRSGAPQLGGRSGGSLPRVPPWNGPATDEPRIRRLASALANWHDHAPETLAEWSSLAVRVGLPGDIALDTFRTAAEAWATRAAVTVGGQDVGVLSDGTLRVYEILVALVDPESTVLLVEEPEASVHPGLLQRVLAEFDAYAEDKQVILATHSPQVVSWARPDELRLVAWQGGQPVVRALDEIEAKQAARYLNEHGGLGEFVFGGGVDG